MGSTQTATELQELPPVSALPLTERVFRPVVHDRTPSYPESLQPLTPANTTQQVSPRVFEAAAPVTYTRRLLITMLIVVANTIQVGS